MRRLVTVGWLARHALAAAGVAGCGALGWWQIGRATGGNALSWAYAVQWPVFAGFVGVIWWREVRRALGHAPGRAATTAATTAATGTGGEPAGRPVFTARRAPAVDDRDDPQLAAYNRYLAWLNANPGARPGDYPGGGRRAGRPEHIVEETTWAQP